MASRLGGKASTTLIRTANRRQTDSKMNWPAKLFTLAALIGVGATLVSSYASAQEQPMQMPAEQGGHQHHAERQTASDAMPHFGRAQRDAHDTLFTLKEARQIARQKNPTLRQAEAGIPAVPAPGKHA